jgi:hypothetical protein
MPTETLTIDDKTYTLAPINFDQYESAMFDSEGNLLGRPKTGFFVSASLKNAESDANPAFDKIPAGHVLKLLPVALKLSGLSEASSGEAKTQEDQP